MRYVEPIKSIILTLLVLLSISLTFMIWSYEPEYEFLEEPEVQSVAIGEEVSFESIVQPYKALYVQEENLYGSVSVKAINQTMEMLSNMELGNVRIAKENASVATINNLMSDQEQVVLFFNATIPLESFSRVLHFKENDVNKILFDRMVIETSKVKSDQTVEIRFVNTKDNTIYRAAATVKSELAILNNLEELVKYSFEYEQFERENEFTFYLPKSNTDVIQFTYFIDEISQDLLKSALFTDASILQKTVEGNQEKYYDSMSLMTFDTASKTMNYVNASAENGAIESAGKLVNDTFNVVNDHGGFTADFRLSSIDVPQKMVEYQLFFQGHPVYSTSTLTRIVTTWGNDRLFRYRRPYYMLDTDITTEKTVKELESGAQVIESLNAQIEKPSSIDDLVIGYYLVQDENTSFFILQPSWFVVSGSSWTRLTPQEQGGVVNGLE